MGPMFFAFTHAEDTTACTDLFKSLKAFLQSVHNINLESLVSDVYLDGSGGTQNAFSSEFPSAKWHRDIEHVKRNISKPGNN